MEDGPVGFGYADGARQSQCAGISVITQRSAGWDEKERVWSRTAMVGLPFDAGRKWSAVGRAGRASVARRCAGEDICARVPTRLLSLHSECPILRAKRQF